MAREKARGGYTVRDNWGWVGQMLVSEDVRQRGRMRVRLGQRIGKRRQDMDSWGWVGQMMCIV